MVFYDDEMLLVDLRVVNEVYLFKGNVNVVE